MKILWEVSSEDVKKTKTFVKLHRNNKFVQARIKKNLVKTKPRITKSVFWRNLILCLVTTQQRSGPNSLVNRFLNSESFLLNYSLCKSKSRIEFAAGQVLTKYRLRRSNVLAKEIKENFMYVQGHWKEISGQLEKLRIKQTVKTERRIAEYFQEKFKGIGPKQSRNLLQSLGLTRYEIPIDSRITKWLNSFGFPVKLTAQGLSDINYYNFISDGIQHLCRKSNLYPCILDAAIFSSFDKQEWTKKNII
jgi:hypothetical protein